MRKTILILVMATAALAVGAAAATTRSPDEHADGRARAALRADLAARRAKLLDELHRYWVRGAFPVNYYQPRTVNIFRDGAGRLCAVANLIHASGRDDLVDMQAAVDNYIALRDLKGGAITDWILASGLTREELVDLQGLGYQRMYRPPNELPRADQRIAFLTQNGAVVPAPAYRLIAERAALRTRLSAAELRLRAGSDASLDVAVDRLMWTRALPVAAN